MQSIKFVNLLPFPVNVYARRSTTTSLITFLAGHGAHVIVNGENLEIGDEIHVLYAPTPSGPAYEILEPMTLVADTATVTIGDVVYNEVSNTLTQRSHSDISGLRFHSKITIPVKIYYRGNYIAYLNASDGTGFMNGSPGSVYVNNNNMGFNIGDKLSFSIVINGKIDLPWCTIMINDNYASDMYLGAISQLPAGSQGNLPVQDFYSYRVGSPNYSGLTYLSNNRRDGTAYVHI